jgi:hypothetical protein
VRWQADFDFAVVVDSDEFVQLFESTAPFSRITIKAFVKANRKQIEQFSQVYLKRPLVIRSRSNQEADPLLRPCLERLLHMTAANATFVGGPAGGSSVVGKALFWIPAAVRPYLHYNTGWPRVLWKPREAHALHIRESFSDPPVRRKTLQRCLGLVSATPSSSK